MASVLRLWGTESTETPERLSSLFQHEKTVVRNKGEPRIVQGSAAGGMQGFTQSAKEQDEVHCRLRSK